MSTITITDLPVRPRAMRAGVERARAPRVQAIRDAREIRPEARRSRVRLTRRGRAVVVTAGVLAVMGVGFFFGAGSVASQFGGTQETTTIVQVEPGQTLWSLASEITPPGEDVREAMHQIKQMNALETSSLAAGQRLRVPFATK